MGVTLPRIRRLDGALPPRSSDRFRSRRRGARQRGFTLMEVLVAVAVLATALAAAIRVGSQVAGNTIELRERAYAGWVAENQLARIQSGIEPLTGPERRSGRAEMADQSWTWSLHAQRANPPLPIDLELPGLLEIEIAVYRADEADSAPPVAVRTAWYRLPRSAAQADDAPSE